VIFEAAEFCSAFETLTAVVSAGVVDFLLGPNAEGVEA
jgi:hypothetical protein